NLLDPRLAEAAHKITPNIRHCRTKGAKSCCGGWNRNAAKSRFLCEHHRMRRPRAAKGHEHLLRRLMTLHRHSREELGRHPCGRNPYGSPCSMCGRLEFEP